MCQCPTFWKTVVRILSQMTRLNLCFVNTFDSRELRQCFSYSNQNIIQSIKHGHGHWTKHRNFDTTYVEIIGHTHIHFINTQNYI